MEGSGTMGQLSETQHMILSSQMSEAKSAKARAEAERQVRLNRIARLQAEEAKLMKRIEETHRRTKDLLSQKAAKEQAAIERQNYELAKSEQLNEHRMRLVEQKQRQKANIRSSQEACWVNRHQVVRSVKERKEWIASEAEANKQSELKGKMQQRVDIRRQDDVRRERQRRAQEMMLAQQQKEQEARLAAEEAKIAQQEQKLAELERREMQLMRSLQSYQGEQREAIVQIEAYLPKRSARADARRAEGGGGMLALMAPASPAAPRAPAPPTAPPPSGDD